MFRVLVSGASGGLGSAIAFELARTGAALALCSRSVERNAALAERIRAQTARDAAAIALDLSAPQSAERAVEAAVHALGGLDGLIHCAGDPADGRLENVPPQAWRESFEVKVFGAFDLARAALPHLKKSGRGVIIALTGSRARAPMPEGIVSGAMNAALENGMKALALDLAEHGIRVLTVSPGPFDTARLRNAFDRRGAASRSDPERLAAEAKQRVPLRRFGEPLEVARLVAFLASSDAGFITGTTIGIDGGSTPGV
jgi:3-oxoacyl-[acyl-carrier protein] reductase